MTLLPNSTRGSGIGRGTWIVSAVVLLVLLFVFVSSTVHALSKPNQLRPNPKGNVLVRLFDENLGDDLCEVTILETGFTFRTKTTENDISAFRQLALAPDTYTAVVFVVSPGSIFTGTCTFEVVEGGRGSVVAFTAPFGLGRNPAVGTFVVTKPLEKTCQEKLQEGTCPCPKFCPDPDSTDDPVPDLGNGCANQRTCYNEEIRKNEASPPPGVDLVGPGSDPSPGGWVGTASPSPQNPCSASFLYEETPAGVDLRPACLVHDRCYSSCDAEDQRECDQKMLENMETICEERSLTSEQLIACYEETDKIHAGVTRGGGFSFDNSCCDEPPPGGGQ